MQVKITLFFILFVLIFSGFSSAQAHPLDEARQAEKSGDFDRALQIYGEMLKRSSNDPNQTKSVLKVYDRMLKIHAMRKEAPKIKEVLTHLRANCREESLELKDQEKLSLIYSRYGETGEALKIQWKIIDAPYSSLQTKAVLRTYGRLLKYYTDKKNPSAATDLLSRMACLPVSDFDDRDIYRYAMLHLKYGDREESFKILKGIVQDHPDSTSSQRALFVLAKEAQRARDYSGAINYYGMYIKRYPKNTYFVQKACQRIVDCYVSQKDKTLSKEFMKQAADWVNGVSDYRSQLDLARDLKFKGMDQMAEAVFHTGHAAAMQVIDNQPQSEEALKAYLEITRTAHELEQYTIAENAAQAMLNDFNEQGDESDAGKSMRYMKSQAYLWLAKIYKENEQYHDAAVMLENFLRLYPKNKDTDYALSELSLVYEKMGNMKKASEVFAKVQSQFWKEATEKRLADPR
ncbi:tetratricopeptide repeat protein [Desulforhabdus amnigena]|jgi:TolA-binding protein|uniref:Tetratricopeptide repeat protein n=1 Tax=Desulforhabdus amnigena TaxID=40218 RepID=A0A9W6D185_9BACT|nr:tetratricopeptide repeat protein [Desulforhabdus amnigena]NLJ29542.1 tetratricopeptide repeat protein [Deltaproteobacteria bacterium]GLI34005.1 hypothetical protein DAMNIGENAA_14380 [Desulforhabdus amnigena]